MKSALLPLCVLIISVACGNSKKGTNTLPVVSDTSVTSTANLPACLASQLNKIENNQYDNPPVKIDEYEYLGKRMFLFTAACCDQYNILFDENCKGTCAPSGGITGRGDGKCSDFNDKAKFVRTIWKKKE